MTKAAIVDGLYRGDSKAIKEAINVLQQAPCEDCVSRQSVIYIVKSYIHEIITESGMDKNEHTNKVLRLIADLISTMQPVTPSQGWIPCSEGLPEIPKDYVYDTETEDFVVYRNKYSGVEIHVKKPTPTYTSGVISKQALYEALYEHFHDDDAPNNITEVTLGSVRNFVKNFPCVTSSHGTCSDCAMKRLDKNKSEEVGAEKYFCPAVGSYVDETPDFYCAAFEKRDSEPQAATCTSCGSVFSYRAEDIQYGYVVGNSKYGYRKSVKCPYCNNATVVKEETEYTKEEER